MSVNPAEASVQPVLFEPTPVCAPPSRGQATPVTEADARRGARLRSPNRGQITWGRVDLDGTLPEDHVARALWTAVERLDLSTLYASIEARGEVAGASAIDPRLLLALWVFATSEGEGSAREIARLTRLHAAYRWLCGGVDVSYHTLADFRAENAAVFSELVTQVLAILMRADLVDLDRQAQDGTRVRASAGAASFRRGQTLEELMAQARTHLSQVLAEAADPAVSARKLVARRRAARERVERLEAALAELPEVVETKKRSGAKDATPRVSTTDPEARVMKMGDGGFRPAYNVQFATTTDEARVVVGVEVTNRGSDAGQSTPMLEQIAQRTDRLPEELLVDGGYAQHDAIDAAAARGVTVFAPVPAPRKQGAPDPHLPRADDSEAVAAWRQRMATDEAKEIYRQRAATAETVNADAKAHRGLTRLTVRGREGALACATLFALTYDLLRLISLRG